MSFQKGYKPSEGQLKFYERMRGSENPMKDPEISEKIRVQNKSAKRTKEQIKRIRDGLKGKEPWNKNKPGYKWSEEGRKKREIKRVLRAKPLTVQELIKRLDRVFSTYIRTIYSKDGMVACFTCDKLLPIKEMQNGHYVSRTCGNLRFSEKNCHPQCVSCNIFREGHKDEYSIRLIRKYGAGILEELNRWKHMPPTSFNWIWLRDQIDLYKEKISKL